MPKLAPAIYASRVIKDYALRLFKKQFLRLLPGELAILQLPPDATTPAWLSFSASPLVSVTHTADELTVVCPSSEVPAGMTCEAGWRAFGVEGKQDFSVVGILSSTLGPPVGAGISSIFRCLNEGECGPKLGLKTAMKDNLGRRPFFETLTYRAPGD